MDDDEKTRVDGVSSATVDGPEDAPAPLRVGRYFIFRRLGEGGMGQVLLGYDDELDRKLAIKLWRKSSRDAAELAARMRREAQALARLSHPNVVQAYEVGDHRGQLYLAMEYVEGQTLREWIHDQPRALSAILERYIQAGRGLAAAHHAGLLHRDFKPDNAVVGADGRVRVLDFGLARADTGQPEEPEARPPPRPVEAVADSLSAPLTRAGSVLGTPAYMPPEQLLGGATDTRADIYAFCVALWEAIYGVRPFGGSTTAELAAAIAGQRPREAPKRRTPGWLRRALLRGLAALPGERWPTMDALLSALGSGARRRRLRIGAAALAAVLALGAGGVGVYQVQRGRVAAACQARGDAIAEVWSDPERDAVRDAALATGQPHAADTSTRLAALLDRYASTWSEAQVDVCRRRDLAGSWDPALAARAEACLGELRWSLEGLVAALREADAGVVLRAVEAASTLPPVALCLDEDLLRRRPTLPDDPALRTEAQAIRRELERALSLGSAGRYEPALALAEGLLDRADALAWAPLVARVRYVAGSLAVTLRRDFDQTEARLEDATFTALAVGDDGLAVNALARLTEQVGQQRLKPAIAEKWLHLGRALLPRLGAERPLAEAHLECTAGQLMRLKGQLDRAAAAYSRCVQLREAVLGAEHPATGLALARLGTLAQFTNDFAGSRRDLERALAILEPALGPEHPSVARQLNELASVLLSLGALDEAERAVRRALAIDDRPGGSPLAAAQDLFRLGTVLLSKGRVDDAVAALERALDAFVASDRSSLPMQISTLERLGEANLQRRDLDAALAAALRGVELLAAHNPAGPEYCDSLLRLARVRHARGEPQEALAQLERATQLAAAQDPEDRALLLVDAGEAWLELGQEDRARQLYLTGLNSLAEAPDADPRTECAPLVALGELALARGAPAEALPLFRRALELGGLPGYPTHFARARFGLARVLALTGGDASEARALAEQAATTYRAYGLTEDLAPVEAWLAEH